MPTRSSRLIWAFFVVGLFASGLAYWQSRNLIERELDARLQLATTEVISRLLRQVNAYAEVLRGVQAQFIVHPDLSRRDFQRLYRALSLEARLPGVQGIAFSARVAPASREAVDTVLERELKDNDLGYPTAFRRAEIGLEDAYIVRYVEPIAVNRVGVGINQSDGGIRRASIQRARDTGDLSVSSRLQFLARPDAPEGAIFFLPLYRGGTVPSTLDQRRTEFSGVVSIAVRLDDMLRDVFGPKLLDDLDIEIYDLQPAQGQSLQYDRHHLLFDSGNSAGAVSLHGGNAAFPHQRTEDLEIGGSTWRVQVTALPTLVRASQRWLPPLAALGTALLSVLAFCFMRMLEHRRRAASARANVAEQALQSKEAQLSRISDAIEQMLWTISIPDRQIRFVSPAVEAICGRPAQAFYDAPQLWLGCLHPEDKESILALMEQITVTGTEEFECRIVRPDAAVRWIKGKAHFTAGIRPGTGRIDGILTDVTELRRAHAALLRNNRALRAIHACDAVIAGATDETDLLQGICEVMVDAGYRLAWAGVLRGEMEALLVPVASAGEHQDYLGSLQDALALGERDPGPLGEALRTRAPVIANRLASDARFAQRRDEALRRELYAKLTLPLSDGDQPIGLLNVYAQEEDAFDAEEVRLLDGLAQGVAVALQSYQHRRARSAAEAALRLRQRAIEACANPIAITRFEAPHYPTQYVNPAFERVTGYPASAILGQGLRLLCREDLDQAGVAELDAAHAQQRDGHAVIRGYRRDGSMFWADVYLAPVRDEAGQVTHFVAAIYDITTSRQYEADLEYRTNFDGLTGLPNRNLLRDRAEQALALAKRDKRSAWLVCIDLDRLKFVNDTLGHDAGDSVLQQVAQRLSAALPATDTVARANGDAFVVVLSDATDEHAAAATMQRLMETVAKPLTVKGHEYFLTCSAGVAVYPADGADVESLMRHADIAMHRAKELGRNTFQFYTRALNARAMERLRLEADLRHAVRREELVLHYQPQVDLHSGRIVGMEALVRWQHPQLGMVSPSRFIGVAEETGLISQIGEWVLRTACQQNKRWQDAGYGALRVAANVSANQFHQQNLMQIVVSVLEETGLAGACLDIELTEGVVMTDVEYVVGILHQIKKLGVKLSIDDFGTGYSSLAYLRRLPVDALKIDQSFVRNLTTNDDEAAIVRSVIALAHSLGLQVIAEGVETAAQLTYLQDHGCDQIQGYYFSEPLPADAFERLLAQDRHLRLANELPLTLESRP
ncbi:diguanylate cyclase (GGDEF) domain protein [compost metagenome]